jgi:hypothetical protein
MKKKEIHYKVIKDLKFNEIESYDEVFYKEYGYPYTIYEKKLTKNVYVEWDQPTRTCEMIRIDKECNILNRLKIQDEDTLIQLVEFFTQNK